MHPHALKTVVVSLALLLIAAGSAYGQAKPRITFDMVVSKGASTCLPDAKARVQVVTNGTFEDMFIYATGLPPGTDFDFFVIQVPNAPFGLSCIRGTLRLTGGVKPSSSSEGASALRRSSSHRVSLRPRTSSTIRHSQMPR